MLSSFIHSRESGTDSIDRPVMHTSMTVTAGAGVLNTGPESTLARPADSAFRISSGVLRPLLGVLASASFAAAAAVFCCTCFCGEAVGGSSSAAVAEAGGCRVWSDALGLEAFARRDGRCGKDLGAGKRVLLLDLVGFLAGAGSGLSDCREDFAAAPEELATTSSRACTRDD